MNDYEPLVVTAELRDPAILDRAQPLDGILAATIIETPHLRERDRQYRRFRRNAARYGLEDAENWWRKNGWDIPVRPHFLPLAIWGHGNGHGLWVYCSSWAFVGDAETGITYFNHHLDAELAERFLPPARRKIPTGKSEFKSEHIPLQYTATEKLTWYVLGIRSEIEDILAVTYAIAKKRNRGYGGIRRWTIEPTEVDRSVITPEGDIMRPIPHELLGKLKIAGELQLAWTAYRPPYWDGRYVARCATSGKIDA